MRKFLLLSFVIIAFQAIAIAELRPDRPSYRIISSEFDEDIASSASVFEFSIKGSNLGNEIINLRYADNGKQYSKKLKEDLTFALTTNPGKHLLEFSIGEYHHEITLDSIAIRPQYLTKIELYFKSSKEQLFVKKPIIYLYPKEEMNVKVKVHTKGKMIFTYPKYDESWEFSAKPNGTLTFGEEHFNYLFWEAQQDVPKNLNIQINGRVLDSNDLLNYIESSLKQFGFTPSERSDFITYWLPLMKAHKYLYLYFVFNEDCDAFAELEISPKPDNIGRFYMLWSPIEGDVEVFKETPQEIPKLNRDGFTVIEWGGAQITNKKKPGK